MRPIRWKPSEQKMPGWLARASTILHWIRLCWLCLFPGKAAYDYDGVTDIIASRGNKSDDATGKGRPI